MAKRDASELEIRMSEDLEKGLRRVNKETETIVDKLEQIPKHLEKSNKQSNLLEKTFSVITKTATTMLAAFAAGSALLGINNLVQTVFDLDTASRATQKTMGALGYSFQKTKDSVYSLSIATGEAADRVMEVYENLANLRVVSKDVNKLTTDVINFSRATTVGQEAAAGLVGSLNTIGKLSVKQIETVMNTMVQVQRAFGLTRGQVEGVSDTIVRSTQLLQQFGRSANSITNFSTGIAKISSAFASVGVAAETANKFVSDLLDPDKITDNALLYSRLGISIQDAFNANIDFDKTISKFQQLGAQMKQMNPASAAAYAKSLGMSVGEIRAMADIDMGKYSKYLKDGVDASLAMKMASQQTLSPQEKISMTWQRISSMVASMLDKFMPIIELVVDAIEPLIKDLTEWVNNNITNTVIKGFINDIVSFVKSIPKFISETGKVLAPIMSQIPALIEKMKPVFDSVINFFSNPALIGGALVVAIALAMRNTKKALSKNIEDGVREGIAKGAADINNAINIKTSNPKTIEPKFEKEERKSDVVDYSAIEKSILEGNKKSKDLNNKKPDDIKLNPKIAPSINVDNVQAGLVAAMDAGVEKARIQDKVSSDLSKAGESLGDSISSSTEKSVKGLGNSLKKVSSDYLDELSKMQNSFKTTSNVTDYASRNENKTSVFARGGMASKIEDVASNMEEDTKNKRAQMLQDAQVRYEIERRNREKIDQLIQATETDINTKRESEIEKIMAFEGIAREEAEKKFLRTREYLAMQEDIRILENRRDKTESLERELAIKKEKRENQYFFALSNRQRRAELDQTKQEKAILDSRLQANQVAFDNEKKYNSILEAEVAKMLDKETKGTLSAHEAIKKREYEALINESRSKQNSLIDEKNKTIKNLDEVENKRKKITGEYYSELDKKMKARMFNEVASWEAITEKRKTQEIDIDKLEKKLAAERAKNDPSSDLVNKLKTDLIKLNTDLAGIRAEEASRKTSIDNLDKDIKKNDKMVNRSAAEIKSEGLDSRTFTRSMRTLFESVGNKISSSMGKIGDKISSSLDQLKHSIVPAMKNLGANILKSSAKFMLMSLPMILIGSMLTKLGPLLESLLPILDTVVNALVKATLPILRTLINVLAPVVNFLLPKILGVMGLLIGGIGWLTKQIGNVVEALTGNKFMSTMADGFIKSSETLMAMADGFEKNKIISDEVLSNINKGFDKVAAGLDKKASIEQDTSSIDELRQEIRDQRDQENKDGPRIITATGSGLTYSENNMKKEDTKNIKTTAENTKKSFEVAKQTNTIASTQAETLDKLNSTMEMLLLVMMGDREINQAKGIANPKTALESMMKTARARFENLDDAT